MLKQVQLIDRDMIAVGLRALMDKPSLTKAKHHIVALSPNSGNFVRMIGEQELKASSGVLWDFQKSLHEVFSFGDSNREVLLVDDNTVTGSQAVAQLFAWMGKPRDQWPVELRGEQNIDTASFSDRDRELFGNMDLTFGFIYAADSAVSKITTAAAQLGLKNVRVERHRDMVAAMHKPSSELKTFLQRVGEELLKDFATNHGKALDKAMLAEATSRALGDGPGCGLLATVFNVPTSTYPALRCPGVFNGQPWLPLFIRRGYLSNLVFG